MSFNQKVHEVRVHKLFGYTFYTPEFIVEKARECGFNPDDAAIEKIRYFQANYLSNRYIELYDDACQFLDIMDIVSNIPFMKDEVASAISRMLLPLPNTLFFNQEY